MFSTTLSNSEATPLNFLKYKSRVASEAWATEWALTASLIRVVLKEIAAVQFTALVPNQLAVLTVLALNKRKRAMLDKHL